MGSTFVNSEIAGEGIDAAEIRRELDRITASPVFRGSKRCQSFIQYVVTKTLAGDAAILKERTLAVEVFGRDESEDLADVSIVRVGAREVRKRLALYYIEGGAEDAVRIELPTGSYIPSFHHHPARNHQLALSATVTAETGAPADVKIGKIQAISAANPISVSKPKLLLLIAAGVACFAGIFAWQLHSSGLALFNAFWKPVFRASSTPVILLAHPIVYQPSTRASRLDEQINGVSPVPAQRAIRVSANLLNGADYVPAIDQFVGFGDAQAALRVNSLLLRHSVNSGIRLASRVDFYDLRRASAVLIGAFTNRWVMELTKNMQYRFGYGDGKPCVQEGASGCRWVLSKTDNGKSTEDYILICRLPHPQTGGFVLIIAGLNVYGTEEAGRIVSDPESLTPILKRLPPRWAERNLQLVLHVTVIGDAPAQSEVVSVHTW